MAQAVTSSGGEETLVAPTLAQLFALFARIGLTSFGGGLSGWLLREVVYAKHWLGEEEFFDILTICQALPGINVVNLSIWLGHRFAGPVGSVICFTGIIVPPGILMIFLGTMMTTLGRYPVVGIAMTGAAAVGIGIALTMGLGVARRVRRRPFPLVVMVGTFAAIGLLHWPMLWVAGTAAVISVALEYRNLARAKD